MPRRGKIDLEIIRASLAIICPHCSASIEPEVQKRLDAETMECPLYGEKFRPDKKQRYC